MHILSRRAHGVLDYVFGTILIIAPRLFGFDDGADAARLPMILGVATLIYSLLTRYELGVIKEISFRAHLSLDVISGIVLAISPWLFQFADRVWAPHLVLGLVEIVVVLATRADRSAAAVDPTHAHP